MSVAGHHEIDAFQLLAQRNVAWQSAMNTSHRSPPTAGNAELRLLSGHARSNTILSQRCSHNVHGWRRSALLPVNFPHHNVERADDFGRKAWVPLIDGSKAALELPYIVDQVITMAELKTEEGAAYRAFICQTINPYGFPAKDRSGRLDMIEEPHLGRLMEKIKGPVRPAAERLEFAKPDAQTADTDPEADNS